MGEKLTRRAALACLGSGALAMGLGSSAFTSVEADRGVSVDIADSDGNALLGVADQSGSAAVDGPSDSAVLFELTDNIGGLSSADLSVELVRLERSDGTTVQDPPLATTVSDDGQGVFSISTQCDSTTDTLGDAYRFTFEFGVSSSEVSVTAERTTVETVAVACDSGDITVTDGNNNGDKTTSGNVKVEDKVHLNGEIDAGGNVTLGKKADTTKSVTAGGDVNVGEKGRINGTVTAGGDVTFGKKADTTNSVTAGGDVTVGEKGRINGTIDAGGNVTVGEKATVVKSVTADGDVTLESGATVNGDICADGKITIGEDALVKGSVRSTGGTIVVKRKGTINRDATAAGDITIKQNATVKGTVSAKDSSIQSCP